MRRALGAVWGGVAAVRAGLYENGWLPVHRLDRPVVSVGGLSVGGTGKTPAVAAVAELLIRHGQRPAILSRGYGRRGRMPLLVAAGDGHGLRVASQLAGDEPTWLAELLPEAVVAVAARREDAAALALAAGPVDLFILDDGFQHLRVRRDVNCLVVDALAPFWSDAPMPHGRLRERVAAAGRADGFFLVGQEASAGETLEARFPGRPVFRMNGLDPAAWEVDEGRAEPSGATTDSVGDNTSEPTRTRPNGAEQIHPQDLPSPLYAFAGIARPNRFFDDLRGSGLQLVGERRFADHHHYRDATLVELASAARSSGALAMVTTEKDAVRLPQRLPDIPLFVWRYRLAFEEPEALRAWLRQLLQGAGASSPTPDEPARRRTHEDRSAGRDPGRGGP